MSNITKPSNSLCGSNISDSYNSDYQQLVGQITASPSVESVGGGSNPTAGTVKSSLYYPAQC